MFTVKDLNIVFRRLIKVDDPTARGNVQVAVVFSSSDRSGLDRLRVCNSRSRGCNGEKSAERQKSMARRVITRNHRLAHVQTERATLEAGSILIACSSEDHRDLDVFVSYLYTYRYLHCSSSRSMFVHLYVVIRIFLYIAS